MKKAYDKPSLNIFSMTKRDVLNISTTPWSQGKDFGTDDPYTPKI